MKFYNWRQDAIRDGRGFHVTIGAFSTPIVGGGNGTIIQIDEPEGVISVPDGTSIMPIRIDVQCQVPIIAADSNESEILIASDKDAAWDASGTSTEETPVNMRTTHGRASLCSCESAFTATATTKPAADFEIARAVQVADIGGSAASQAWGELRCLYEPQSPMIFDGPCQLVIYWGGTVATTGFAQVEWIEYPTNYVT